MALCGVRCEALMHFSVKVSNGDGAACTQNNLTILKIPEGATGPYGSHSRLALLVHYIALRQLDSLLVSLL
jgi:hypothetical protein